MSNTQTKPQEHPYNVLRDARKPLTAEQAPMTPRPSVKPVYGLCGHVARSERHTCGAHRCIQQWGW